MPLGMANIRGNKIALTENFLFNMVHDLQAKKGWCTGQALKECRVI
jgi:hypothetical protein